MKRMLWLALPLALIVGCSESTDEVNGDQANAQADALTQTLTQEEMAEGDEAEEMAPFTVDYVCPYDTNFTVEFSADGEQATLYDQADRVIPLTIAPAASGAFYKNDEGVSLHTKGDIAIVEFVKDKPINCTVWKGHVDAEEATAEEAVDHEAGESDEEVLYLNPKLNEWGA